MNKSEEEIVLSDKVAVVTGAANGIGLGIAEKFVKENIKVVIADIDIDSGKEAVKKITNKGGSACFIKVDLTKEQEIEALFEETIEQYGHLDILICNAGVQIREWATDFQTEAFDYLMSVNLRAYYLCARTAAKYMKEYENGGAIVCISSVNSMSYHSKRSPYNISKAAINGLVGTLGVEWGRFNIRINAVAPGYVLTDLMKSGIQEGIIDETNIMSVIPMKRYIGVEEISNVVYFFVSEASSGVTGQVLCVDGGWSKNALPESKEL